MDKPLLVVAGNYREYRYWCSWHDVDPLREAVYVSDGSALHGRRYNEYVLVGTWFERRDLQEISEMLRVIDAVERQRSA